MNISWMKRLLPLLALALPPLALGCAPADADFDTESAPLLRGRYTFEQPAVGSIRVGGGACTATLFGSARTVITAAHCVDYGTTRSPGRYGDFSLEPRPGERYRYTIQQYVSLGRSHESSERDVALIQLAEAVPASVATPLPPSLAYPTRGSAVTIYGFGCQHRSGGGDFSKQAFGYRYGENTYNLCPGDSGGPTLTARSELFRINSAYIVGEGRDLFGDVVAFLSPLRTHVDRWREGSPLVWEAGGAPPPSDPPPSDPPPSDPPPPPPPSDPPPSDPPPSDPPPPGTIPPPLTDIDVRCRTHRDCGSCANDSYCGWCGAGYCEGLRLDGAGRLAGNQCTSRVTIADWLCSSDPPPPPPSDPPPSDPPPSDPPPSDPPPSDPPPSDPPPAERPPEMGPACGPWDGLSDYTCVSGRQHFARCGAAGPEFLACPSGYYCREGSTELLCWSGR